MRRSIVYLVGAVILATGIMLVERPWKGPDRGAAERRLFDDLDPAKVERIEIERLLDGVELLREGTEWRVRSFATPLREQVDTSAASGGNVSKQGRDAAEQRGDVSGEAGDGSDPAEGVSRRADEALPLPADAAKVQEALEAWRGLATTSLASTNPDKQMTYQVNTAGLQMRAYDATGRQLASVYVGKQGPDFVSTYVRKDPESQVYLTRDGLAAHFSTRAEHWQKKTVNRPKWLQWASPPLVGGD